MGMVLGREVLRPVLHPRCRRPALVMDTPGGPASLGTGPVPVGQSFHVGQGRAVVPGVGHVRVRIRAPIGAAQALVDQDRPREMELVEPVGRHRSQLERGGTPEEQREQCTRRARRWFSRWVLGIDGDPLRRSHGRTSGHAECAAGQPIGEILDRSGGLSRRRNWRRARPPWTSRGMPTSKWPRHRPKPPAGAGVSRSCRHHVSFDDGGHGNCRRPERGREGSAGRGGVLVDQDRDHVRSRADAVERFACSLVTRPPAPTSGVRGPGWLGRPRPGSPA